MKIVFLGPPGAGKGTQARRFSEEYNLLHISTGDLLRSAVKKPSQSHQKIQTFMQQGALVPDDVVTDIVRQEIQKAREYKGFILDGFPRNQAQAERLDALLAEQNEKIDLAVNFQTPIEVVRGRLLGRRVCTKCGANYHLKNLPPRSDGRCSRCGGELVARQDDQDQTIEHRIKVFKERSQVICDFYRRKELFREISGEASTDDQYTMLKTLFSQTGK